MNNKKKRDLGQIITLYNLCDTIPSCVKCPMLFKHGTHYSCNLPTINENPSYIPTAINLLESFKKHLEAEAQFRRRILFDETK